MKRITQISLLVLLTLFAACDCKLNSIQSTLPQGYVGSQYNANIYMDTSCEPDLRQVTLISGFLPPGVSINSAGQIMGTPSQSGTFNFTIEAKACFSTNISTNQPEDCQSITETLSIIVN